MTAVPENLQMSSLWKLYPVLSVALFVVLLKRIRRQRRVPYSSTQSAISDEDCEKNMYNDGTTAGDVSNPATAPLPSACDILRPLSTQSSPHSASVPTSGSVAALAKKQNRENTCISERERQVQPELRDYHAFNQSSAHPEVPVEQGSDGDTSGIDERSQQTVQKRSETVQIMREADSGRTWKRRVREYS
ncbi:hypothetical protein VTN00DRAFT_9296 [Thermoascus crustaceus]|uniref:uncharacterized protein n=1 Tax=Thermoascus crustaceus TaxID=5088 RepID=UPI0037427E6F